MRRLGFLLVPLLVLAFAPLASAHAQVLVMSQNKCDLAKQGAVRAMNDSTFSIMQELVEEGMLISASAAYHLWGDEWNVVFFYVAKDIPSFLDAFSEAVTRWNERYPESMAVFQGACFEHKDSFYSMGKATTPPATAPDR